MTHAYEALAGGPKHFDVAPIVFCESMQEADARAAQIPQDGKPYSVHVFG